MERLNQKQQAMPESNPQGEIKNAGSNPAALNFLQFKFMIYNIGFKVGFFCGVILGVIFSIFIAFLVNSKWEYEAVKQKKAEYYLDSNNNREWRWLP